MIDLLFCVIEDNGCYDTQKYKSFTLNLVAKLNDRVCSVFTYKMMNYQRKQTMIDQDFIKICSQKIM